MLIYINILYHMINTCVKYYMCKKYCIAVFLASKAFQACSGQSVPLWLVKRLRIDSVRCGEVSGGVCISVLVAAVPLGT